MTSASPLVWPELEDLASKIPAAARGGPSGLLQGAFKGMDLGLGLSLNTPYRPCTQHPALLIDLPSTGSGIVRISHSISSLMPSPHSSFHERLPRGNRNKEQMPMVSIMSQLVLVILSYSHQDTGKEMAESWGCSSVGKVLAWHTDSTA